MKSILLSTLALGALTSAALAAGPVPLTDEQMDSVTAGKIETVVTNPGGQTPPGQQDQDPPNDKFDVVTENQNPQGKAPPGQN